MLWDEVFILGDDYLSKDFLKPVFYGLFCNFVLPSILGLKRVLWDCCFRILCLFSVEGYSIFNPVLLKYLSFFT